VSGEEDGGLDGGVRQREFDGEIGVTMGRFGCKE